jgi:succinate dehydrogenase/fumarate reductase flavoprotein subunit
MVGGRILIRKLLEETSRHEKIRFLPGFFVYKILLDEDHLRGVIGFNKEGELCQISCRAMILATGGAGGIYKRNDNYKGILGDGYALALEIGLPLIDMEFVQFFPFGFAEPGLPKTIIYPPYPEGVRVIDAEGNDFLKRQGLDMSLDKIIVDLRDRMASLIYKEDKKGGVFMDYTQIPDSRFEKFPLSLFPKKRFNFKGKPFRISPLAHFSMGGIKIGPSGETHIQGLLAVGEVAGGVHGANRMGGNALTECLVFGAKSGHLAAEFAKSHHLKKGFNIPEDWPRIFSVRMNGLRTPSKLFALRKAVRNLAWKSAGPLRNEKLMREGLSSIDALTQEQKALEVCSVKDLISKRELENSLSVLKAILLSSLARKESRGAFQREDFPQEGGAEFLKRVSVKMKKAEKDIEVSWEDSDS